MKFGREFRERLLSEGYPESWVERAFPYRLLKKSLHGVQSELLNVGLDPDTLDQLLATKTEPLPSDNGLEDGAVPVARFDLADPASQGAVCPRLTVILELEDGKPVNSRLSPSSKEFLRHLANSRGVKPRQASGGENVRRLSVDSTGSLHPIPNLGDTSKNSPVEDAVSDSSEEEESPAGIQRKTIELEFENHHKFFDMIQRDLRSLDDLEKAERLKLEGFMSNLHTEITAVIKRPRKILIRKSDLTLWREIFEVYMDAQIFFAHGEIEHGTRDRAAALKQLAWFESEVQRKELNSKFQLEGSQIAYDRFLELNRALVVYSSFQAMNTVALGKILKKFQKRTHIDVSPSVLKTIHAESLASEVSRSLCVRMSNDLATLIPPLNQYTCPVCCDIAYLPIWTPCKHLFCTRCIYKLQQRRVRACPQCREPTVLKTYMDGIDANLVRHLERYYPDKCREKNIQDRTEIGQEVFGVDYKYKSCVVM